MSIELKRYRYRYINGKKFNESVRTVLVDDHGRKYLKVLMMDSSGLIVKKVPKTEVRYMTDVTQNGRPKSIKTVARQFRAFGKQTGMTKAAKSFLRNTNQAA